MQKVFVSSQAPFGNLMKVSEGMSYNNDQFQICARGKQIQRLFDVLTLLVNRERVSNTEFEFSYTSEGTKHIPELTVTCTSINEE